MSQPPPGNRNRRPKGKRGGDRPRPGRRAPPPPQTGEEMRYLNRLKEAGSPLVVTLADGQEIRGVLEEVDRHQITMEGPAGPIIVRKIDIRYIREAG